MGKHFLLNLYGCSSVLLDDEKFLINLIEESAIASGAKIIKTVSHKFSPHGITAICLLSESHISIHTWPEEGKCSSDIYTCGLSNPKIGCDNIIDNLKPNKYELTYIQR